MVFLKYAVTMRSEVGWESPPLDARATDERSDNLQTTSLSCACHVFIKALIEQLQASAAAFSP